jgi:outer membrane receptor for ferric coprogen and ferric-rhodotorulic acid
MAQAPTFTSTFDATQSFDLSNGAELSFNAEAYTSAGYWADYTHKQGFQTAYQRYDARITYAPSGKNWEFSIWAKNLSNKAVFTSGSLGFVDIGEPRTYGVRGIVKF